MTKQQSDKLDMLFKKLERASKKVDSLYEELRKAKLAELSARNEYDNLLKSVDIGWEIPGNDG
jgi:hypothetical protein